MPFDYLHSTIPHSYSNAGEKAEVQYLKELKERASMLNRLRYEKEEAIRRLTGNINWDWECNKKPEYVERLLKAVPQIVEEVFSKPPASDKGRVITSKDLKTLLSD